MVIIKASFDPAVDVMSSPSRTKAEIWSGATVRMNCQPPPDYEGQIHPDAGRSHPMIVMPRQIKCTATTQLPRCFLALKRKRYGKSQPEKSHRQRPSYPPPATTSIGTS
jgi:hypothetical protein